jgi:hypothetical protein
MRLSSEEGLTMPFRSLEVLQSWVAEFELIHAPRNGAVRVIPQDGDDGADTGLVAMRILNSPTEIYLEPPRSAGEEWTVTFEPREEPVRLKADDVRRIANELATLAELCAFLQQKSHRAARPPLVRNQD